MANNDQTVNLPNANPPSPADGQAPTQPDTLGQPASTGDADGGGEPLFGPAPDSPLGSVLDPDSGVFEARGSHSAWEQYSEQAFSGSDPLIQNDGHGGEGPVFGFVGHSAETSRHQPLEELTILQEEALPFDAIPENLIGAQFLPFELTDIPFTLSFPKPDDNQTLDDETSDTAPASQYDPMFSQQWYLKNTTGGVDINVVKAWEDYTGKGVKVAVNDSGIDYNHPDLSANYLHAMDWDAGTNTSDGSPKASGDNHGTNVAGFIGAAKNGTGIMGIAHEAGIAGMKGSDRAQFLTIINKSVDFDVSNNSWNFDPFEKTPALDAAFKTVAENGRGGLGTVTLFCSSNERELEIMSDMYTMSNSPYTLTVAAVKASGVYADFSSAGPNILVTAPGDKVLTTDRTPPEGENKTGLYHTDSGTSFSTPITSGVVALMLEANTKLGYRDVHEILAKTAVYKTCMTDAPNTLPGWGWNFNKTHDWNGGGIHTSHDYGFGLVDATAAVRLAESWNHGQHTYANQATLQTTGSPGQTIPDGTGAVTLTTNMGSDIIVQQALLTVDISHGNLQDLVIQLTSPQGTESIMLWEGNYNGLAQEIGGTTGQQLMNNATGTFLNSDTWTFKSVTPFGEHGQGDWTITAKDTVAGTEGTFNAWTLDLYGDTVTVDDLYMYTDFYSDSATADAGRKTLADTSGTDTINATTVTSNSTIDLAPGATSTIDNTAMTISGTTVIENAHTGDGNDSITGNTANNSLFGWRGNDILSGLDGNDTLSGGVGTDILTGGTGNDIFYYGKSSEGSDTVKDFSHADDTFNFDYSNFGQSSAGNLAADHFFTSAASVDVSDACFYYESSTLWYDADGTGSTAADQLAHVTGDAVDVTDIAFV